MSIGAESASMRDELMTKLHAQPRAMLCLSRCLPTVSLARSLARSLPPSLPFPVFLSIARSLLQDASCGADFALQSTRGVSREGANIASPLCNGARWSTAAVAAVAAAPAAAVVIVR